MIPEIGDTVIYKSKIDNGPGDDVLSPAIVIRTQATTVPAVVERWGPDPAIRVGVDGEKVQTAPRPPGFVAELPDEETVDLVVFGLGKTYREYAVRRGHGLGQWTDIKF